MSNVMLGVKKNLLMIWVFLCAFLKVLFDRLVASPDLVVRSYFQKKKPINIAKQLEDFKWLLLSFDELLNDAKQKQLSVPNVKEWLDKVKERLYEADSVIEKINTKDSGLELEKSRIQKQSKVLQQRLDEVVTEKNKIKKGALRCKKIKVESGSKDEGQESINVPCISQVNNRPDRSLFNHCTLEDFVLICHSQNLPVSGNEDRLVQMKKILGDIKLTDQHGRPTSVLVGIMKDMASQLVKLHGTGKFHGDLKPQNVLIKKATRSFYAELSDHHYTGCETEDLLNLGCVFFFGLTGRHLIGHDAHCYREANNVENKMDLFWVEDFAEAHDLIIRLVRPNPKQKRLKAIEVLEHPLLWKSRKRLSFLRDTSDLLGKYPDLLEALDETKLGDLGRKKWKGRLVRTWDQTMHRDVIKHMLKYKKYDFEKVSGLLRFIRNTLSHYKEFPENIKALLIGVEERRDLDAFFASRYPKFFMEVYNSVRSTHCKEKKCFKEYFKVKGNVYTS